MKKLDFNEKCYKALMQVPHGKVTTYKQIANYLGSNAYRAVGNAMHNNPNAPRVPCHRVVKSTGELGGYAGGVRKKVALLKKEGVDISKGRVADLERCMYRFKKRSKR